MLKVINLKPVFAKRGCAHFAKRSEAHTKWEVRGADYTSSSRSRRGRPGAGVNLARRVIQVHAESGAGHVLASPALARDKFMAWRRRLPAGCIVAMAASSSAHHCARCDQRIAAAHAKGNPALKEAAVAFQKNARILWAVTAKVQAFDSPTRKQDSA